MNYTIRVKMEDGKYWKICDCLNEISLLWWLKYYVKKYGKERLIIKPN